MRASRRPRTRQAGAADRALILHDGPSARLFLRYHAEARTTFHRAYGSLVKALERDAATDSPNEATDPPAVPADAVSPNEADSGASPDRNRDFSDPPPRVEPDPSRAGPDGRGRPAPTVSRSARS